MEESPTFLSQEGYDRLVQQLEELKEERVEVTKEIRVAMADKDFRENSPLDAAKEKQGRIETQIRQLESTISSAQILPENGAGTRVSRSAVGTRITVRNKNSGDVLDYTLVDAREADIEQRRLSTQSPVGQALLNLEEGEEVTVPTPAGDITYIVQQIATA